MEVKVEQKNIHVNPGFLPAHGQPKIHLNPAFLSKSTATPHIKQEHKAGDQVSVSSIQRAEHTELLRARNEPRKPIAPNTATKYINPSYLQQSSGNNRYGKNQLKSQSPRKSSESSYSGKYTGSGYAHTYPGSSYTKKYVDSAYSKKYVDSGTYQTPSDYFVARKYVAPKHITHNATKKMSQYYAFGGSHTRSIDKKYSLVRNADNAVGAQSKSDQFGLSQDTSKVNLRPSSAYQWSAAGQKPSVASQPTPSRLTQDMTYVKAVHNCSSPKPKICNDALLSPASQQSACDALLVNPPGKAVGGNIIETGNMDSKRNPTSVTGYAKIEMNAQSQEEGVITKDKTESKRNSSNVTIQSTGQKSTTSTILVNPNVIKSSSKSESRDLLLKLMPGTESLLPLSGGGGTGKTSTGSKTSSDYKILSKTKLVRNKTTKEPGTKENSSLVLGKTVAVKPHKSPTPTKLHLPSFKVSHRRGYSTLSRTKLVRNHGSSGHIKSSTNPGKPKYSVNTKNKLVRRRSKSSSEPQDKKAIKPELEKHKKFSVLSKTKLVRRRSNSGVYKASVVAHATASKSSQVIIRKHKLVRNGGTVSERYWLRRGLRKTYGKGLSRFSYNRMRLSSFRHSHKHKGVMKDGISKYKINRLKVPQGNINGVSKYKINRLKVPQLSNVSKYKFNRLKPSPVSWVKRTHNYRYVHGGKMHGAGAAKGKGNSMKTSDRFVNIGGILYKSTKTSLRLHQPQAKVKHSPKVKDSLCVVSLRGHKFQVSAKGRTLKRVGVSKQTSCPTPPPGPTLSRVHIGGLTYCRTKTGQYELTQTHHTRALLSWARHRSMATLVHRKKRGSVQKRNEYCTFFNRFGRCTKKDKGECPYIHDPKRVAICTRFLRGRCPVTSCPFSHTVDPERMPVCSHFLQASCSREDCPYRHVRVSPNAPLCLDFVRGHCQAGQECKKQHILVCEEYSQTGKCPRGAQCPLSHHRKQAKVNQKYLPTEGKRDTHNSQSRKRKKSENEYVLGQPKLKRKTQRKKKNSSGTVHSRYFQLTLQEQGDTASMQGIIAYDICEQGSQLCQGNESKKLQSDSLVDNIKKEEPDESINDNSCKLSSFEDTRQRLLLKVEKMKQSYSTDTYISSESLGSENIHCTIKSEKIEQQSEEGRKCEECGGPGGSGRETRRPLPQKLPSYIPLSMADEPEGM